MEILDQQYELLEVAKLRPHPMNPNEGDQEALEESVDTTGFYGAVTVRPHPDEPGAYQILAGEHRWRLAARRGQDVIPAIVLEDCDDVKAAKIVVYDNEVTRRGRTNQDKMDAILESMGDIRGTIFDHVLDAAGRAKDEAEAERAAVAGPQGDGAAPYSDDGDSDSNFIQEWGVLVLADSELEQVSMFESLAKTYGASKLRVVSV